MVHPGIRVGDVVDLVDRGEILLPEFQRGFVWRSGQILRFLDSLYQDFPVGQILVWSPPASLWKEIESVPARRLSGDGVLEVKAGPLPGTGNGPNTLQFILDGQQRITALYRVLKGQPGARVRFHVEDEVFHMESGSLTSDPRWVPVEGVLSSDRGLSQSLVRLQRDLGLDITDPTYERYHANLERLALVRQRVLGVELVRLSDVEQVSELFIRVNSGTPLRKAELTLARLAWRWPGALLSRFEEALEEFQEQGFDLSTSFLMRCYVALATGQAGFRHLESLWAAPSSNLEETWDRAYAGAKAAVAFLREVLRVTSGEDLPSMNALVPVVTLFGNGVRLEEADTYRLAYWFLVASTYGRYGSSVDSRLNEDLKAVNSPAPISALLDSLGAAGSAAPPIAAEDLQGRGPGSPAYFLVSTLFQLQPPRDWFPAKGRQAGERIPGWHALKPWRLFSAAVLEDAGQDPENQEELANLVFLSRLPRGRRASLRPNVLLEQLPPEALRDACIPRDRTLWFPGRIREFLAVRRELMARGFARALERLRAGSFPSLE